MKLRELVRKKPKGLKQELVGQKRRNQSKEWKWPDGSGDGEGDMSGEVEDQPFPVDELPNY